MKLLFLCVLLAAACAQRPLDGADVTTDMSTDPACTNHAASVLVPDTGGGYFIVSFVSDGTNVYYANYSTISSVPVHGGTVQDLGNAYTQLLTLEDQHLYYPIDGCNVIGPGCPAIVDYDLVTAQSVTYTTPIFTGAVVPTSSTLFGFSLQDVLRVDRASDTSTDNALSISDESVPAVLGTHAFYWGSDDSAQRYDLTTGIIDVAVPASELVSAVATDGVSIFAATPNAFITIDEDSQLVTSQPHASAMVGPFAADAAAFYWAAFDDSQLHITTRATGDSCHVVMPGTIITTIAEDAQAIYAVVISDMTVVNAPAPLVRIEK